MALKKVTISNPKENKEKPRLDQFLAFHLPEKLAMPVSKSTVRRLIVAGAVYLNGSRVRIASKPVFAGAVVDIHVDFEKLQSPSKLVEEKYVLTAKEVLFEDEDFIAVLKPAGIPTQPTIDKARRNLFNCVREFMRSRDGVASYLGLHHRLDRDTSGVVIFTKSQRANGPLARLFQEHQIEKTYVAICEGGSHIRESEFEVKDHLAKDPTSKNKMARFKSVRSGGDYAETLFRVLERKGRFLKIEARPKTGRTHQIRVHLSEFGCPVAGDSLYGARELGPRRILLHAFRLRFQHPFTDEALEISSPIPPDFNEFWSSLT